MAPLQGCRVVNLAVNVPGPVAAARLQALGATVCKVEPPGGDPLATAAPAWYRSLTAGQEVRRLDLKSAAGREELYRLLAGADLLLTAQRPSALTRLGLSPAELGRRFPHLAHVAIVGYPAPRQEEPGHDLTYLAEAGLLDPPALPRTLLADLAGAERAVAAALALLLARQRGLPLHPVEVSLAEAASALAEPLRHGLTAPGGLLGGGLPFYRCYPAREGWVAVAALEPHFAQRLLAELLEDGELLEDTGQGTGSDPPPEESTAPPGDPQGTWDTPTWDTPFPTPGARGGLLQDASSGAALPMEVEARLAAAFRRRTAEEWEAWARSRDLPIAAVRAVARREAPAGR
ncbi:CoA transferase [Thermaerobacter sp. PB12/4term]|nr:CoA transferase [Thermaerobacter sp. PB12/4term]